MSEGRKKGRSLLLAVVGTAAAACGPGSCAVPALYPDGGAIPGCYCGNAASTCFFEDGGACAGELFDAGNNDDAGLDGGSDGGADDGGPDAGS